MNFLYKIIIISICLVSVTTIYFSIVLANIYHDKIKNWDYNSIKFITEIEIPSNPPNPWCGNIQNIQQKGNTFKKIISMCAYQPNINESLALWIINGLYDNEKERKRYYPDWVLRVYIPEQFPSIEPILLNINAEYARCKLPSHMDHIRLYRFIPYDDKDVSMLISRDLDARLGIREMMAVHEWMASDYSFYSMHDHSQHFVPVLAGMFGIKRKALGENITISSIMKSAWGEHERISGRTGEDQNFLQYYIWPKVKDNAISFNSIENGCHEAKECKKFPPQLAPWHSDWFVGVQVKNSKSAEYECLFNCSLKYKD